MMDWNLHNVFIFIQIDAGHYRGLVWNLEMTFFSSAFGVSIDLIEAMDEEWNLMSMIVRI